MNSPLVLIVGAGPTGMTLAIELRRAGLDVRIIDKASHPAEHSQALVVQSRTLEQFQRYGIARQAVERGRKLLRAQFFSDRKEIVSLNLDSIPSRYPYLLFIPQSETEAILNEYMESLGVRIERETELVSFIQQESGVSALVRHKGVDETVTARWIVGCDGAHSPVRTRLQIPFEGESVGLSFFLGDLEIEGPDAPSDQLSLHLHEGNVVFMGRLSDKLVRLIVALHSQQGKQLDDDLTLQQFQDAVDQAHVQVRIKSAEWMTPFHVNDRQAASYRVGNAFLAGDASHIHSPVGGQGMNTGIQDAANLGWKLAAVANGADPALLDSYGEERIAVGKNLLRKTGVGLKMASSANPFVEALRDALAPIAASLTPVQHAIAGFISEVAINYRASSVICDRGGDGRLRAGDRLPDFPLHGAAKGALPGTTSGHAKTATLLGDWQDARPLAIVLNAPPAEAELFANRLPSAKPLLVQSGQLDEEGRRALGVEPKLLLIRPDGYIGYRGPIGEFDPARLKLTPHVSGPPAGAA